MASGHYSVVGVEQRVESNGTTAWSTQVIYLSPQSYFDSVMKTSVTFEKDISRSFDFMLEIRMLAVKLEDKIVA